MGFLDPLTENGGFDSLRFQIFEEGASVFDQTFANAASADAFFDDNILNLGLWTTGLSGDLDLAFQFDLVASGLNDGYSLNLIAGVTSSPVPLPASVWLFASGLLGLLVVRRRTRRE